MSHPVVRVFVDATNCKPQQGGIRTYTLALCEALASHSGLSLVVASSIEDFDALPLDVVRVSSATRDPLIRALWRERSLVSAIRRTKAEILFTPVPELPFCRLPVPSVIVVHDIGPLVAPALYGRLRWLRYRATLPRTLRGAERIVCVSEATRDALTSRFESESLKCVVIGEGPQALAASDAGEPKNLDPYVLYVGSLYRHKNVHTLIRAWQLGGAIQDVRLRVVGPAENDVHLRRLRAAVDTAGIRDRVTFDGFVEPERLAALLREAQAVALPSLYEGFGLTALEAMAAGVPVVASAIPALIEVVGDAGVLIDDPESPKQWHSALCHVLSNPDVRLRLGARGRVRARSFTWTRAASELTRTLVELVA